MMTAGAVIILFFIVGMFLSALGSSPKPDSAWPMDTEPGEDVPNVPAAQVAIEPPVGAVQ